MQAEIADLRAKKLAKAPDPLDEHDRETVTYSGFPNSHCIKLRTHNPSQWIMREIGRRACVVAHPPDGTSSLTLAAARLDTSQERSGPSGRTVT